MPSEGFSERVREACGVFLAAGLSIDDVAHLFGVPKHRAAAWVLSIKPETIPTAVTPSVVEPSHGTADARACNCAACGEELVTYYLGQRCIYSDVAGRVRSRPYCKDCLEFAEEKQAARKVSPLSAKFARR